jgi:hypothetical protein
MSFVADYVAALFFGVSSSFQMGGSNFGYLGSGNNRSYQKEKKAPPARPMSVRSRPEFLNTGQATIQALS